MAEVQEPVSTDSIEVVPGLVLVKPADVTRLTRLLSNAWRIPELWDDAAKSNPGLWFMSHYTNPTNMLFDVADGQGLIAFIRTIPGWRSQVYFGAWGRGAMRAYDLWRTAGQMMMSANDLIVVDGFVHPANTLSRRTALRMGMTYRGLVKDAACYNGIHQPMCWYEIDRADLGLPEVT